MSKKFRQSGLSLTQLLMACICIGLAALLVIKVMPEYIVYYKVLSGVRSVAKQANSNPTITVPEIRTSLRKHFEIDSVKDVTIEDMDIGKTPGNQVEISFDYERVIPLFANISLMINFKGSSDS